MHTARSGKRSRAVWLFLLGASLVATTVLAYAVLSVRAPRFAWAHNIDAERWHDARATDTLEEAASTIINMQPFIREFGGQNLATIDQILIQKTGIGLTVTRTGVNTFTDWVPSTGGSFIGGSYVPYYGGTTVTTRVPTKENVSLWMEFSEFDHIALLEFENGGAWPWGVHLEFNSSAMRQGAWTTINFRLQRLDQARKLIDALASLQVAAVGFARTGFGGLYVARDSEENFEKLSDLGLKQGAGVRVVKVIAGSPAAAVGLQTDDIIIEANGQPVTNVNAWSSIIVAAVKGRAAATVQLKVFRDDRTFSTSLTLSNFAFGKSWYHEPAGTSGPEGIAPELWAKCQKDNDLDACTTVIESGKASASYLAIAYYRRGLAHDAKGAFDLALADYAEAIRISPFPAALAERGDTQTSIGNYDKAIEDLTEAIRQDPAFTNAYHYRARAYREMRNYRKAIQDHNRAISLYPTSYWLWTARCLTRAKLDRDLREGLQDCNRALELKPADPSTLYARAFILFRDDKLAEARADLDAALATKPDHAAALFLRGVIRKSKGDTEGAASDIALATSTDPRITEDFRRHGIRP